MIIDSSKDQEDRLTSWKEKSKLAKAIEFVSSRWEHISTLAKEHRDSVAKVLTIVSDHHESLQTINHVIVQGEKILNSQPPDVFDVEMVRTHLKRVRVRAFLASMIETAVVLVSAICLG